MTKIELVYCEKRSLVQCKSVFEYLPLKSRIVYGHKINSGRKNKRLKCDHKDLAERNEKKEEKKHIKAIEKSKGKVLST